jgi:hypothetical protein
MREIDAGDYLSCVVRLRFWKSEVVRDGGAGPCMKGDGLSDKEERVVMCKAGIM